MKTALLLLLSLSLMGCPIRGHVPQTEYRKAISFFPTELVNHFPEERSYGIFSWQYLDSIRYLFDSRYSFFCNMILLSEDFNSKEKFDSQAEQIKKEVIQSYIATDSAMLFVFTYHDKIVVNGQGYNKRDSMSDLLFPFIEHNKIVASGLPVPWIGFEKYGGNTFSGIDSSFTYYVIDAKPGKYLPDEYLNEPEVSVMPPEWIHGFTKGAAISAKLKTIIYWIAVW